MRTLAIVLLLVCAGCFIDGNRSLDVSNTTPALCSAMPTTCGTNLVGRWVADQDCAFDVMSTCPKYEWTAEALAPTTLSFRADGVVHVEVIGHSRVHVVFSKECSATDDCYWSPSSTCSEVNEECRCTFDKHENISADQHYVASLDGDLTFDNFYLGTDVARYCVDGDSFYLLYLDGAYVRFKRG